jgi:lipopolysaccharide/colanic/teichoic acid biosynthesis glycosyltransferase
MGKTFYARLGKGWLDAAFSLAGLILLSPALLIIATAIKLTSPGPVFFRQVRIGQFGKRFWIYKFRTMIEQADRNGLPITAGGDCRITPLGRWLRKTKIDELPQLFNVLVCEMSLVGPRPEVPEYTGAYKGRYARILLAKPGITGPAANAYVREEEILASHADSANFYVTSVLPKKLDLDLLYCNDIRFARDLSLILFTLTNVAGKSAMSESSLLRMPQK